MPGKRSNGEGTLRKRPNGLWECSMMVGYKDNGTRRYMYQNFYGASFNRWMGCLIRCHTMTGSPFFILVSFWYEQSRKWWQGKEKIL